MHLQENSNDEKLLDESLKNSLLHSANNKHRHNLVITIIKIIRN